MPAYGRDAKQFIGKVYRCLLLTISHNIEKALFLKGMKNDA